MYQAKKNQHLDERRYFDGAKYDIMNTLGFPDVLYASPLNDTSKVTKDLLPSRSNENNKKWEVNPIQDKNNKLGKYYNLLENMF